MPFYQLLDDKGAPVPGERRWLEDGVKVGNGAPGEYARMRLDPDQRDMTPEYIRALHADGKITKAVADAAIAERAGKK